MTFGFKFGSQIEVIIKFTVIDDDATLILITDWLMATGDVDDAQPSHTQKDSAIGPDTLVVGPAVTQGIDEFAGTIRRWSVSIQP